MDLIKLIEGSLSDDLLKPEFRRMKEQHNRFFGHCYAASEAYYHLRGGKAAGLKPMRMRHAGVTHWWVDDNGKIVDITAAQFVPLGFPDLDYSQAVGCGFLTKKASQRAQEIMRRVKRLRKMLERFRAAGFHSEPHLVLYAVLCGDSYSRGIWSLPIGTELRVVPPYGANPGHAVLYTDRQVLDHNYMFSREISIEDAKSLIEKL